MDECLKRWDAKLKIGRGLYVVQMAMDRNEVKCHLLQLPFP